MNVIIADQKKAKEVTEKTLRKKGVRALTSSDQFEVMNIIKKEKPKDKKSSLQEYKGTNILRWHVLNQFGDWVGTGKYFQIITEFKK